MSFRKSMTLSAILGLIAVVVISSSEDRTTRLSSQAGEGLAYVALFCLGVGWLAFWMTLAWRAVMALEAIAISAQKLARHSRKERNPDAPPTGTPADEPPSPA